MRAAPAYLLLALAIVAGCGGGTSVPPDPESNPSVVSLVLPPTGSGLVEVRFTLIDPESDPIDLEVEYSPDDGRRWYPATLSPDTPGTGLPSSPGGVAGMVRWDSLDMGFRGQGPGLLRIKPWDPIGVGASAEAPTPVLDNLRVAAERVEFYMIHYGPFDSAATRIAETYDLVIVHPFAGKLSASKVHDIQDGVDSRDPGDDVIVLGYISIGEDSRTVGVTDAEMALDPRFIGDGTGPRIDPRGPDADGQALTGLPPLGDPSNGGSGFASWFLDDNSVDQSPIDVGDGIPDRNSIFGGCFVNAGDPAWFVVLDDMLFDGPDGLPGMKELLTDSYGRGYACDGLFLDTIDTCAPNYFTDSTSPNQSEYEWTAAGFRDFIARVGTTYPDRLVLQNRGLFLFDPRHEHYSVTTRASIDFLKFESFRLNSNTYEEWDPYFFPDNKYNYAPKLMAEANRADGFRILSLGYAEGPPGVMDVDTLTYQSMVGYDSLLEDIYENEDLVGFRHYLTDGDVNFPNTFVADHASLVDTTPPFWTSTHNDNDTVFPVPPLEPTPRIGVQELIATQDSVTVRWDVALDRNRVEYALYYQSTPFDFTGDPDLASANRVLLQPAIGDSYETGIGFGVYPHEQTITGLTTGASYWFCIRAFDSAGNEEKNETFLTTTLMGQLTMVIDGDFADWGGVPVAYTDPADVPDSAGPDWLNLQVANDQDNLYLRYTSENPFNLDGSPTYGFSRTLIFIDCDASAATGYAWNAVGSELMVYDDGLYAQDMGTFNAGFLEALNVNPTVFVTDCELAIPLARIEAVHPGTTKIRLLFINDDANDSAPDFGFVEYTLRR